MTARTTDAVRTAVRDTAGGAAGTAPEAAAESAPETAAAVRVRVEGDVSQEALAYLRFRVEAAFGRPGLPDVDGDVRISRAVARHTELPWSARAEFRVGRDLVVVHAEEASARELADRLHDRLRSRTERAVHRRDAAHRPAAAPPWRGGPAADRAGEGEAGQDPADAVAEG